MARLAKELADGIAICIGRMNSDQGKTLMTVAWTVGGCRTRSQMFGLRDTRCSGFGDKSFAPHEHIDPYNEIEHRRPPNMTETEYVSQLLGISGSANWVNKADIGIVIHCDTDKDPALTEIQVRKVRFKSVGKIGTVALRWDRVTGRYAEMTASAPKANPDGSADKLGAR